MYQYEAKITRVIDGDTVEAQIELGFHVRTSQTLRLIGIDAPEMHGDESEAGEKARKALSTLVEGHTVVIETHEQGSFGRWLATIYFMGNDVNRMMLSSGNARIYEEA